MATNEILPFASTDTGTNLLTQAEYVSDAQRTTGNQPGIARSKLVNKALRQSSLLSAGLAEFIADYQSNNVSDGLTAQNIADYLLEALMNTVMPAGAVIFVPFSAAPSGFIKCNGVALSRTTYSRLFDKIGTTFGSGDGSTTFNVPDLRGEFLRGWDDSRGVDSGRAIGSWQRGSLMPAGDNLQNNSMTVTNLSQAANRIRAGWDVMSDYTMYDGALQYGGIADLDTTLPLNEYINHTGVSRPRNVAMLACMKY